MKKKKMKKTTDEENEIHRSTSVKDEDNFYLCSNKTR